MRRRLWWATLPYYGWVGTTAEEIADGARPCPWYAHPLAWLHRLVERLGGAAFDPLPEVVCDCEECREALASLTCPTGGDDG